MEEKKLKEIQKKLADFETRLDRLEKTFGDEVSENHKGKFRSKQKTLREIISGKKFENGQEQIAAVVGYHEQVMGKLITKNQIKEEWINAKMVNKFDSKFISRAKDKLIRIHPDKTCDLTQTGEKFFENLTKHESSSTTSK